jgi:topoisomerase-4 subunit A
VGLTSNILPHNFCELCQAAISYLRGEDFQLFPDFPTGGSIDVSRYNDGQRGGGLRVRAKIEKLDTKTLVIREIPFSKTTTSLIDSILKAIERGKIKVKKVDDNTAANVEILVHLAPGVSSDKTIDALYAFTDCEINITPNCCVIVDKKPMFLTVSDLLRYSADHTKDLLRQELEIRKGELEEQLHFASLEKIFIEERIYKGKPFENAPNMDAACEYVDERLTPFYPQLIREVTKDDILRLMEIKMHRILKFNKDKADELILRIKADIEQINYDLNHLVDYTVKWYEMILGKYGSEHPRLTEIKSFDTIVASTVVEANQKLYINRNDGFIGTGLKKDEYVCNCSDIDDIIVFYRDGKYKVVKVAEKIFVGKNILHVQVFKKNDTRTIYNVVYRDGKRGSYYMKRFNVTSLARDKEYDLTQGTPGSRVVYFTCNPNGEAELIKVTLDPNPKIKKIFLERDFSDILIKGRGSKGNLLTKYSIHRIALKSHGHSTLGGRKVWWDPDVCRLNYDEHGQLLGEFNEGDSILVVLENGEFYISNFDSNNHYESNVRFVEKWKPEKVWTAVLFDADQQGYLYLKRFKMEATKRHQNYLGDNPNNREVLLTQEVYPRLQVNFGGDDANHEPLVIEADEFIAVKGFKARGKRVTTLNVESVEELEPTRKPEPEMEEEAGDPDDTDQEPEDLDPDKGKSEQQIITELTGQQFLQFDEDM